MLSLEELKLCSKSSEDLRAEAVEGLALSLERIDDVKRSDSLAACVLSVGDRVADHVLEEDL